MKKLAIVVTHPIQYYAPLFQLLHERQEVRIHVFYTLGKLPGYDPGFGKTVAWDIPFHEGYPHTFIKNVAGKPGSHHFFGISNPGLKSQLLDYEPDAILIYGWAYLSHLRIMRYFKNKIPVWFRGDSTLLDDAGGLKAILRRVWLKIVYRDVDKVFYVGLESKRYFLKYGVKGEQLKFAPHAVDNARFAEPRVKDAATFRCHLGIPLSALVVLFAGKLINKKDVMLLVQAFKEQAPDAEIHLIIAGDGPLRETLEEAAAGFNIHFTGFINQSDMPAALQSCDIYCLPSLKGETWGLSVNEAMAAGKAILVSDKCGCAADLVKDNVNGFKFRAGSLPSLREQLRRLISGGADLPAMGHCSRRIISDYTISIQAEVITAELISRENV